MKHQQYTTRKSAIQNFSRLIFPFAGFSALPIYIFFVPCALTNVHFHFNFLNLSEHYPPLSHPKYQNTHQKKITHIFLPCLSATFVRCGRQVCFNLSAVSENLQLESILSSEMFGVRCTTSSGILL